MLDDVILSVDYEDITAKEWNFLELMAALDYERAKDFKDDGNINVEFCKTYIKSVQNLIALNKGKESIYYKKIPQEVISELIDVFMDSARIKTESEED